MAKQSHQLFPHQPEPTVSFKSFKSYLTEKKHKNNLNSTGCFKVSTYQTQQNNKKMSHI